MAWPVPSAGEGRAVTPSSRAGRHSSTLHQSAAQIQEVAERTARRDEGFMLPSRPPLKGMPRLNFTPGTDGQRKRLHAKLVKPPKPFAPTVEKVKEIVPAKLIPKLKPR